MKVGLLFAGQGSQYQGMAQDFALEYPEFKEHLEHASSILKYDVLDLLVNDYHGLLNDNVYTQPAVLCFNHGVFLLLQKYNIQFDCVAGLSLGEYNALIAANVLDFSKTLEIVMQRASIMSQVFSKDETKMAAILKADLDIINEVLQDYQNQVEICNYNTYDQIVIGGQANKVDEVISILKTKNQKRIIELSVSQVSHMSLLSEASKTLEIVLNNYQYKTPNKLFINNVKAEYQTKDFACTLAHQISCSTRMADTITLMLNDGVDTFIEISAKPTQTSFVKSIAKAMDIKVDTHCICDVASLKNFISEEL